jgi:hypothetical protein
MKPSNAKKKSKKKKRPSPPATEGAPPPPPPPPAGSPRSPLSETLTLAAAAAAASEAESAGSSSGGDVSAYSRSFTPSSSSSGAASTSSFYAPSSSSSSSAAGDERRDLAWLLDAFGSATIDQVETAYRDAGADPFLAAGILASTHPPPPPPPPPDLSPHTGSAARKPARRPRKLPVAASGMVADVIGKGYSRPATPPVSVPSGRKGTASNGWNDVRNGCGPGADPAYNVEEAEQFLCSMLGDSSELNMGVVRDVLGESSVNTCC